jgi:MFS transporter, DHA1 family, inner membrane transport protein
VSALQSPATEIAVPPPTERRQRALLWALLFGNFVTGTGILLPAGMLTPLAQGLSVSVPQAGVLLLVSGFLVAIGAPVFAAVTSRFDRRRLLAGVMLLYAVAHALSALSDTYQAVFAGRVLIAVTAAIFTPQAAATLGALLPPERRSHAITMVFVGWSLATVGGMPLGGYIAETGGWQMAFALVAGLSAVATLAVWLTVPGGVRIQPLSRASWARVFTSRALLLVLLVTVLNGTGQFTFFTYLNPSLKVSLAADATLLTIVLAWYGCAATLGNILATRLVVSMGPAQAVLYTLIAMALGLGLWGSAAHSLAAVLVAAAFWGLGTFATNSIQQARLAGLAPEITSASIALNTSAIYLGQALGSGLGGLLITAGALPHLPWVGAAILVIAAVLSQRAAKAAGPPA